MGILSKLLVGKMAMNAMNRSRAVSAPGTTASTGEFLPATGSYSEALGRTGNAVLSRATEFYKQNPRKVQMLGVLAGAALLSRLSRRP